MRINSNAQLDDVDFAKGGGIVPLVAQHADTGEIRMLGYADRDALAASLEGGLLHFYSRSRARLWKKGETSGHTLTVVSLHLDCDADAVVALVRPSGPTCHTGAETCFGALPALPLLAATIEHRATEAAANKTDRQPTEAAAETGASATTEPPPSYTVKLLTDRNLRLKKIAEEAGELTVACADGDADQVAAEAADLLYHALVACRAAGVRLADVAKVLNQRHR